MAEIFISYTNEDHAAVLRIVDVLKKVSLGKLELNVDIRLRPFEEQLPHALETAQCIVFIWSRAAAQSKFVQQETRQAIQAWSSNRLVIATLDDTPLPVGLRDLSTTPILDVSAVEELLKRFFDYDWRMRAGVEMNSLSFDMSYRGLEELEALRYAERRRRAEQEAPKAERAAKGLPSSFRPIRLLAIVALCFVILLGLWMLVFYSPPPSPAWFMWSVDPLIPFLVVLILGAAIGGIGVSAWTILWRRRSDRAPSARLQTVLQPVPEVQVFVSYSRQDARIVDRLVKQIEGLGFGVWIDREASGPQRYAADIVRAIRMSKLVALMCSQNAFSSDHVIREVYVAGDYRKPFIAFLLDPTEFPDEVLYFLSGFPRLPIAGIDQQRLQAAITRLVSV